MPQLSAGALDVQRLMQAGVGEEVVLAFITNSTARFSLTPDGIIQLKSNGVPSSIVSAMIGRDQQLPPELPPSATAAALPQLPPLQEPEGGASSIVANDSDWPPYSIIADDEGYAPEQPPELGPVRAPYPVRLNDPIVIMKLPSFTIPYW